MKALIVRNPSENFKCRFSSFLIAYMLVLKGDLLMAAHTKTDQNLIPSHTSHMSLISQDHSRPVMVMDEIFYVYKEDTHCDCDRLCTF